MRAKTRQSLIVKDFIVTNKKEAVVTFKPNTTPIKTCKKKGLPTDAIKHRLLQVDLLGEVEVLINPLMD